MAMSNNQMVYSIYNGLVVETPRWRKKSYFLTGDLRDPMAEKNTFFWNHQSGKLREVAEKSTLVKNEPSNFGMRNITIFTLEVSNLKSPFMANLSRYPKEHVAA